MGHTDVFVMKKVKCRIAKLGALHSSHPENLSFPSFFLIKSLKTMRPISSPKRFASCGVARSAKAFGQFEECLLFLFPRFDAQLNEFHQDTVIAQRWLFAMRSTCLATGAEQPGRSVGTGCRGNASLGIIVSGCWQMMPDAAHSNSSNSNPGACHRERSNFALADCQPSLAG